MRQNSNDKKGKISKMIKQKKPTNNTMTKISQRGCTNKTQTEPYTRENKWVFNQNLEIPI